MGKHQIKATLYGCHGATSFNFHGNIVELQVFYPKSFAAPSRQKPDIIFNMEFNYEYHGNVKKDGSALYIIFKKL